MTIEVMPSNHLILCCPFLLLPSIFPGISLVQFSHSVVPNSLQPHGLQHARPPCPSPTPGVYPDSCPFSRWCHQTISSSVVPFSSCLQSFPTSGSFQMSQLFTSGGKNIGVSTSTSVLPMNTQDWSPLGWTGWISLQSKELSKVFYNTSAEILQHSTFCIDIQTHETRIPSYCNIKRSSLRHIISNCKKSLKKKEF